MLKQSHNYWKNKAEQEWEYAKAEEAKFEELQEKQNAWNKRLAESSWLLRGALEHQGPIKAKSIDDKGMEQYIDDKMVKIHKYELKGIDLPDGVDATKHISSADADKGKRGSSPNAKKNKGVSWGGGSQEGNERKSPVLRSSASLFPSRSPSKSRDDLTTQQKIRKMLESEERKEREEFLQKSMERMKVLTKVDEVLSRPKLPRHHHHARLMVGNTEDTRLTKEQRAANLRPEDRAIMQIQPVVEELRPWSEVIDEENQSRILPIPGRYHQYMGAERLYPLNKYPATIAALLPKQYTPDMIPENILLKDAPSHQQHQQQQLNGTFASNQATVDPHVQQAIKQQKTLRIKKSILDLSRSPIKHYPITAADNNGQQQQRTTMFNDNTSYAASAASHNCSSSSSKQINQQFHWRTKDYPDSNSVYFTPHQPVIFYENEMEKLKLEKLQQEHLQELKEKEYDSVANSGKKYHLLSNNDASTVAASSQASMSTASYIDPRRRNGDANSVTYPLSIQQQEQQPENESYNAVRSNYMAENSIRTEPHLPVKLVRLRNSRNLKNVHLKNDLHFISLQEKEQMEKLKKQKFQENLFLQAGLA